MPPKTKAAAVKKIPRTPTREEIEMEARAVERIRAIGKSKGYHRLSSRVSVIFKQYRYQMDNMKRRNNLYRSLSGLLIYGLNRCTKEVFLAYSDDLLKLVRDTYPGGDDEAWLLHNLKNRPTKDIDIEDMFEDKQ